MRRTSATSLATCRACSRRQQRATHHYQDTHRRSLRFCWTNLSRQNVREHVIHQRPGMGPDVLALMTADLQPDDLEEQYRRMPWIWRVAIAVGRRNDGGEILDMLEVCVPRASQPLEHWQAVVIGGGLINEDFPVGRVSRKTPRPDSQRHSGGQENVASNSAACRNHGRRRSCQTGNAIRRVAHGRAAASRSRRVRVCVDTSTRKRITSFRWARSAAWSTLKRQRRPHNSADALSWLKGNNRYLALEGMLRTDERAAVLAASIESGRVAVSSANATKLTQHAVLAIRTRAVATGIVTADESDPN